MHVDLDVLVLTFEGRKLFPERKSYTVQYDLSPEEALLYGEVMRLQRRLASSPRRLRTVSRS